MENNDKDIYDWHQSERFINPYNFVSIASQTKKQDINGTQEDFHTGVLSCRLITKTPLAVPDSENMEQDDIGHISYPFYQYRDGIPAIPGSTLRGSIRSVYETITNSCFSTAKEDAIITSRGKEPFLPGILKKEAGQWRLYSAKRYRIRVKEYSKSNKNNSRCKMAERKELEAIGLGTKVYFKVAQNVGKQTKNCVADFSTKKQESWKTGYLYCGEPFAKKHFESIFYMEKNAEEIPVPNMEKAIAGLKETVRVYNNEKINRSLSLKGNYKHSGYPDFEQALENGLVPVWYTKPAKNRFENKQPVYLSIACVGRMAYERNMGEILGNKKPCTSRNRLCKACALFGMASEEKIGSRIRITDAIAQNWTEDKWMKGVTLRELSSPKPSYLPFYTKPATDSLESKGRQSWSYDEGAEIRGRKFYWHAQPGTTYYRSEVGKNKRNTTMDLVDCGAAFVFQVYYDHISTEQLEELIWTLTLGDNREDSSLCYKIGHGKPIGLGSVKIVVDKKTERCYENGYHISVTEKAQLAICDSLAKANPLQWRELQKILDRNTTNINYPNRNKRIPVAYPQVVPGKELAKKIEALSKSERDKLGNKLAAHQWFGYNYQLGNSGVQKPLPEILETDITLPALEAIQFKEEKPQKSHSTKNKSNGKNPEYGGKS